MELINTAAVYGVLLVFGGVSNVVSFSTGPVPPGTNTNQAVCSTLDPTPHHGNPSGNDGFRIFVISETGSDTYSTTTGVTVYIEGINVQIGGFMVQARRVLNGEVVGTWHNVPAGTQGIHCTLVTGTTYNSETLGVCANGVQCGNTWGHSSNAGLSRVRAMWTATADHGTVEFVGTFQTYEPSGEIVQRFTRDIRSKYRLTFSDTTVPVISIPPTQTVTRSSSTTVTMVTNTQQASGTEFTHLSALPGTSSTIIPVSVVIVIVVYVAVIIATLFGWHRHKKRKRNSFNGRTGSQTGNDNEAAVVEMMSFQLNRNGDDVLIDTLPEEEYLNVRHGGLIVIDPTYWDLQWRNLRVGTFILGHGNFGEVREGMVKMGATWIRVAIKTLPDGAPETEVNNFARELENMKKIGRHINIVSLVGSVRQQGQLYVALEHVRHGDLLNFLKNSRLPEPDDHGRVSTLTSSHLLGFGLDVAKGMKWLADQGLIHRDLAARNILVGEGPNGLIAKVSDFGMTRGDEIYYQRSNQPVPLKWTALESLIMQIYSTYSDVWSFGILLWEIITLGETPYRNPTNISNRDLKQYLQQGYRLPKPPNCDANLYDVMTMCWRENPSDRPTFERLITKLVQLLDDESIYVINEIPGNLRIADRDLF